MLSVVTPTHDPTFLGRLNACMESQVFTDFEWVIVPNGGIKIDDVLARVTCKQARIVPYTGRTANIGELKRFACDASRGEVLVEVDHDDEITNHCLARLADEFDKDDADFLYSNCAEVRSDLSPYAYDASFGWEYRPFDWRGREVKECIAFAPEPASFSRIWFAPNHVRAWRSDFYQRIGGHDPSRDVLDDHDLMCRSYIHGRVRHLNECLYVYHVHPGNTCRGVLNAKIQTETLALHDRYIYRLVERWCDLNGLRKIDLCGGIGKPAGYESVDVLGGDVTADLNDRWPFEDGTVGLFRAHDALEHLANPVHSMMEAYRCLAPKGWMLTRTPSTDGRGAFQDPTHVSFWNSNSFWYYTRIQQAAYIGTPVRFQLPRIKNYFPTEWHKTHNIVYVKADLHKFHGRTPGRIEFERSAC